MKSTTAPLAVGLFVLLIGCEQRFAVGGQTAGSAGLQVLTGNGTMRPFILVGIENTERRRDMTGPTRIASDSAIAPRVGGSEAFRAFIRDELMPEIRTRYRTAEEISHCG